MKRTIILMSFIILASLNTFVIAAGNLGQSGANFLQIGVEPRGAALGGGITALATGADALYWNPAGAVQTNRIALSVAHTDWFVDTRLTYGGAVFKVGENNALGISLTSFYMDEMEVTTVYEPNGTGEYWNAGDLSAGLSYARRMTDQFTFGITGKYINEYIWHENASQLGLDVGSIYRADFMNLRLGMVVRNFGGTLKHSGDDIGERIAEEEARDEKNNPRLERLTPEFRLPQVFQMGVALDVFSNDINTVTLISDVNVPSDNQTRLIFASEYSFQDMAALRVSYCMNYDVAAFAFGGGIQLAGIKFDYSFSNQNYFKGVHRFGVKFSL